MINPFPSFHSESKPVHHSHLPMLCSLCASTMCSQHLLLWDTVRALLLHGLVSSLCDASFDPTNRYDDIYICRYCRQLFRSRVLTVQYANVWARVCVHVQMPVRSCVYLCAYERLCNMKFCSMCLRDFIYSLMVTSTLFYRFFIERGFKESHVLFGLYWVWRFQVTYMQRRVASGWGAFKLISAQLSPSKPIPKVSLM